MFLKVQSQSNNTRAIVLVRNPTVIYNALCELRLGTVNYKFVSLPAVGNFCIYKMWSIAHHAHISFGPLQTFCGNHIKE